MIEISCREGFENTINPQNEAINEVINEAINKNALSVLLAISKSPCIKRKVLLELIDVSKATLERIIKHLSSEPLSLIEYQGSLKTGGYVLTGKGQEYVDAAKKNAIVESGSNSPDSNTFLMCFDRMDLLRWNKFVV